MFSLCSTATRSYRGIWAMPLYIWDGITFNTITCIYEYVHVCLQSVVNSVHEKNAQFLAEDLQKGMQRNHNLNTAPVGGKTVIRYICKQTRSCIYTALAWASFDTLILGSTTKHTRLISNGRNFKAWQCVEHISTNNDWPIHVGVSGLAWLAFVIELLQSFKDLSIKAVTKISDSLIWKWRTKYNLDILFSVTKLNKRTTCEPES